MPPGGAYGQGFPGGAQGFPGGAQGFLGEAQGFLGGGFPPSSRAKAEVIDEKVLLVKVNAYIRGMFEFCKNDRSEKAKQKAQQNPEKKSGKSTPAWDHAEPAFLGQEEPKSDLELYLMKKNVSEEVPFDEAARREETPGFLRDLQDPAGSPSGFGQVRRRLEVVKG